MKTILKHFTLATISVIILYLVGAFVLWDWNWFVLIGNQKSGERLIILLTMLGSTGIVWYFLNAVVEGVFED